MKNLVVNLEVDVSTFDQSMEVIELAKKTEENNPFITANFNVDLTEENE